MECTNFTHVIVILCVVWLGRYKDHDDNDEDEDVAVVSTLVAQGRSLAVCVRALGRMGVSYHALLHAYASTSTETGATSRTTTSSGVDRDSGDSTRGDSNSGGGLSSVLTAVSPHSTAHSLSTLLHGFTLLASNAPSGHVDTLTAVTTPPTTSAPHAQGLGLDCSDGLHMSPPSPLVALPPAFFRALISVRDTLTPQGVALVVYALGKLEYSWNHLEMMGNFDDDLLGQFYGLDDKGDEYHDDGDDDEVSSPPSTKDASRVDGVSGSGSGGVVTPSLTEALLSTIAREAPQMNAQVQG